MRPKMPNLFLALLVRLRETRGLLAHGWSEVFSLRRISAPPKPGQRFRGLLVLGASILVIILATGVSYYFERQNREADSKTPIAGEQPSKIDPTREWKSHTNKTYNFSIKYPKEWQRLTDFEKGNSVLYVGVKDTVDDKEMPKGIELIVQKNPNGTRSVEYANKIVSKAGIGKDSKIYPSDFAEIDATIVEDLKDNPSPRAFISGRGILLEIRSHSLFPDQDKQLFKQILYTFRFVSS